MSGMIEARAAAFAEARAGARRKAIQAEADALPGVRASVEGDAVVLEGRNLLRRWVEDARLRYAGRAGR